jgi:hypothetical protein
MVSDGKLRPVQISRRAALGVAAVAVAGCQSRTKATPPPAAREPDAAALETARRFEAELLAAYDLMIKRTPLHARGALQVERAIHSTHLSALGGTPTHASSTSHRDSAQTLLRATADQLRRLALGAADGANAALFASIAASHTASAG